MTKKDAELSRRMSEYYGAMLDETRPEYKGDKPTVSQMDDHREHVVVNCEDRVHVLPKALLEDVADGELSITAIDDYEEIVRVIVAEWLEFNC